MLLIFFTWIMHRNIYFCVPSEQLYLYGGLLFSELCYFHWNTVVQVCCYLSLSAVIFLYQHLTLEETVFFDSGLFFWATLFPFVFAAFINTPGQSDPGCWLLFQKHLFGAICRPIQFISSPRVVTQILYCWSIGLQMIEKQNLKALN